MENTSPLLFEDSEEKYYLNANGATRGPLTAQDIFHLLTKGEISALHYLWRQGLTDWIAIYEEDTFSFLKPKKPSAANLQRVKTDFKRRTEAKKPLNAQINKLNSAATRNNYLHFNGSQFGPFSQPELEHVLKSGKLNQNAYLWQPGWPQWKRVIEIPAYASALSGRKTAIEDDQGRSPVTTTLEIEASSHTSQKHLQKSSSKKAVTIQTKSISKRHFTPKKSRSADQRSAPRRPLVARLFLHNDKDVMVAICRDISIGGMQVLTDKHPGPVGSIIKLNVSPGDNSKVKGFIAEGQIVRLLEDGRGFSFRFRKLSEEAKRTIQSYISKEDV